MRRLQAIGLRDWRELITAAPTLAMASLLVARSPFERAVRFGAVARARIKQPVDVARAVWAVKAIARRLPMRAKCIEQGIALQRRLRSRGHDAILHYGVRKTGDMRGLEAHVWVSLDGETIIGGEEAGDFVEVARYP